MPTLDLSARWLATALQPLATAVSAPDGDAIVFVETLGWTLPTVPQAWRDLGGAADGMLDAFGSVLEVWEQRAAAEATDADLAEKSGVLVASLALLFGELAHLPDGLRAQLPADYVATTGIADAILGRLFDALFEQFLRGQFPLARHVLILLGVVERTARPEDPARHQPAFTEVRLVWNRLGLAISDPAQLLRDTYGWGTPTLDASRLFDALVPLSFYFQAPAEIHVPSIAFVQTMAPELGPVSYAMLQPELWVPIVRADPVGAFVVITPLPPSPAPQALTATLVLRGDVADSIELSPYATVEIEGGAQIGTGLAMVLRPGHSPRVQAEHVH